MHGLSRLDLPFLEPFVGYDLTDDLVIRLVPVDCALAVLRQFDCCVFQVHGQVGAVAAGLDAVPDDQAFEDAAKGYRIDKENRKWEVDDRCSLMLGSTKKNGRWVADLHIYLYPPA